MPQKTGILEFMRAQTDVAGEALVDVYEHFLQHSLIVAANDGSLASMGNPLDKPCPDASLSELMAEFKEAVRSAASLSELMTEVKEALAAVKQLRKALNRLLYQERKPGGKLRGHLPPATPPSSPGILHVLRKPVKSGARWNSEPQPQKGNQP